MRSLLLHIVAGALKACALLFGMLPVRRRVALLSRQGEAVSMDFRLLMEEISKADPGIPVETCFTAPETQGIAQFAVSTLKQLRLARTSSVVVADGYIPAVSVPAKRKGVSVLQMWHALGAIKRFGYQCLDTEDGRSSQSARILRMHRNYDLVLAGGPWAVDPLAAAFDVPASRVVPTGLPRIDFLRSGSFSEEREEIRSRILERFPQLAQGGANVLFAPTFRRNDPGFSGGQLALACESAAGLPLNLVFAGHPLDSSGDRESVPGNVLSGTGFATIELLLVADALVTDYSAVAYEAAALGVPVYFYVPDIGAYRESPGLNLDPLSEFPSCSSTELAEVLRMVLSGGGEGFAFARSMGQVPSCCGSTLAEVVLQAASGACPDPAAPAAVPEAFRSCGGMVRGVCGSEEAAGCDCADADRPPAVVVAGRGYANILNAVRSLGEAGYRTEAVRVFKNASSLKRPLLSMAPESFSRYVDRYSRCVATCDADLLGALEAHAEEGAKKLLIPVDDFVAAVADRNRDALSGRFLLPGVRGGGDSLERLMRKDVQKKMAAQAGLNVVPGSLVHPGEGDCDLSAFHYPCFAKPNVSAASSKSKLARCDSPEELERLLRRCAADGDEGLLVEELVDVASEVSVIGVAAGGAVLSPGIIRSVRGGCGQRRGVMLAGEVAPSSEMEDVVSACSRMVAATGFEGVFDIDLLVARDGTVYFAELNYRPGASTYAVVQAGANLPAAFAGYMLRGEALSRERAGACKALSFANEKVLLEECAAGGISPARARRLVRGSDVSFVGNDRDPGPYREFRRYGRLAWLLWLRGKLRCILRSRRSAN